MKKVLVVKRTCFLLVGADVITHVEEAKSRDTKEKHGGDPLVCGRNLGFGTTSRTQEIGMRSAKSWRRIRRDSQFRCFV